MSGFESFCNAAGRIPSQHLPSSSFSSPVILCHNASLQSDVCFCTSQQKKKLHSPLWLLSFALTMSVLICYFSQCFKHCQLEVFYPYRIFFFLIWKSMLKFLYYFCTSEKNRLIMQHLYLLRMFYSRYVKNNIFCLGFLWPFTKLYLIINRLAEDQFVYK